MPKRKVANVWPSIVLLVGACVTRTAIAILALIVGISAITSTAVAQTTAAPAMEAPSNFKFAVKPPPIVRGQAYAFDLCHGKPVNLPNGNQTNWEMFGKDTAQGECNVVGNEPTTVSGTDAPVHFELGRGTGFQPIGMWLGANGLLYGTPSGRRSAFGPKPFSVCAVTTGGHSSCQEINLAGDAAANKASHAKVIGAVAAGGAAAVVVGAVAMRSSSSSSGGSCGTPPANLFNDCSSIPQSPNCPADLKAQDAYCKCEGYSGFNAGTGSCQ
jgi:hypothetical protein